MLWFFERQGRQVRLEVLYLDATRYEVRIVDADGAERVEYFTSARDVADRQIQIQQGLAGEGWKHTGSWKL